VLIETGIAGSPIEPFAAVPVFGGIEWWRVRSAQPGSNGIAVRQVLNDEMVQDHDQVSRRWGFDEL
jgi:hypothetical protein